MHQVCVCVWVCQSFGWSQGDMTSEGQEFKSSLQHMERKKCVSVCVYVFVSVCFSVCVLSTPQFSECVQKSDYRQSPDPSWDHRHTHHLKKNSVTSDKHCLSKQPALHISLNSALMSVYVTHAHEADHISQEQYQWQQPPNDKYTNKCVFTYPRILPFN